ncbi:MAG: hypothetical protein RR620_08940 [Clostridium sp.]
MKKREFVPRENLLKVNGEKKSREAIGQKYIDLIEDDYNVTVDEICDYLRVSKPYFNRYKTDIKHISISTTVRTMCIPAALQGEEFPLITKRILYSRSDFERFILENVVIESYSVKVPKEIALKYKEFDVEIFEKVMKYADWLGILDSKNLRMVSSRMVSQIKLADYKDIMISRDYKHTTNAYEFIKSRKLSRYIFFNSVRYSMDEINSNHIVIPYDLVPEINEKKLMNKMPEEIFESFLKNGYKNFPHYFKLIHSIGNAKKALSKINNIINN